jgi:flagellar motor switch protein FliN
MTTDQALLRLGQSTSEAVLAVLEMLAPGQVAAGEVAVAADPLADLPSPAVATSVSYVEKVTGGNVFVTTLAGAQGLAATMMGLDGPADPGAAELSELEQSAASEAMNQMMASAAIATSTVLGTEVEIGPPETRTFGAADEVAAAYPRTPYAIRAAFTVCGEPCRLVQLVPHAFVVRMTSALDERAAEVPAADASAAAPAVAGGAAAPDRLSLAGIRVRVWAELGRAELPAAQAVGMPAGAVVELNRSADEPIDLYVNGRRFATGRLMVVDGTDWAVKIETVLAPSQTTSESGMEVARWPESS